MKKKGGKKRVYIRKGTNDTNAAAAIMISLSNDHHLPYQNDSFHGPRLADRGCHPQWSDGKRGEYDRNDARKSFPVGERASQIERKTPIHTKMTKNKKQKKRKGKKGEKRIRKGKQTRVSTKIRPITRGNE